MEKKISIKENVIKFDRSTLNKNIEEIITSRFGEGEFKIDSSIDDLHDPYLLKDMDKAVARIKAAKEKQQRVIIFGDYDVDGVTATSIMMHFFKTV
jgi:single-stranded-DNA-specific exonuclease